MHLTGSEDAPVTSGCAAGAGRRRRSLVRRRALRTLPLVHSSHSCTICRQPRSPEACVSPTPSRTQTPASSCAPSGRCRRRRGAWTARTRCLSHSSQQHPAKPRPAARPPASPGRGKGKSAPAPGKDTPIASTPGGGRGGSGGAGRAGAARGWEPEGRDANTRRPRGERGALGRAGRSTVLGGGGGTRETAQAAETCEEREEGRRDGQTDGPDGRGRRAPRVPGARGGSARRAGGREGAGILRAQVQEGSAWCSSSGPGGLRTRKAQRGLGGRRCCGGHARRVRGAQRRAITGKSKWR